MEKPQDIPDMSLSKPKFIEKLEQLPSDIIHAMTQVEVEEKIRDAAESVAAKYYKKYGDDGGNYPECVRTVSGILSELGQDLPGQLGLTMIGKSKGASEQACAEYYSEGHPQ